MRKRIDKVKQNIAKKILLSSLSVGIGVSTIVSGMPLAAMAGNSPKNFSYNQDWKLYDENVISVGGDSYIYHDLVSPEPSEIIEIATATDFLNFADGCKSDAYSYGCTFVLANDLIITDKSFAGVPYFNGVFDGNGHTINFERLNVNGSNQGFFRYVGSSGLVKNLNVSGEMSAEGSKDYIGGFVGVNYGIISGCKFSGKVNGNDRVGGFCGMNKIGAVLSDCTNEASVLATNYTGGIAGYNEGTITHCSNYGAINIEELDSTISIGAVDVGALNLTKNLMNRNDMGGIAGYSNGVIRLCTNHGTVGYPHTGYNVGGVVGGQSGTVLTSYNYGDIYGRKDVGGIVGQAEPYIESDYLQDKVASTQEDLNQLNNTLSGISGTMRDSASTTKQYAEALTKEYKDSKQKITENVEEIITTVSENRPDAEPYVNNINEAMENITQLELAREYLEVHNVQDYLKENYIAPSDMPYALKSIIYLRLTKQLPRNWKDQVITDWNKGLVDAADEDIENIDATLQQDVIQEIQYNTNIINENLEEIYKLSDIDTSSIEGMTDSIAGELKNDTREKTLESMVTSIDQGAQNVLAGFDAAEEQINQIAQNISGDLDVVLGEEDGFVEDISSVENAKEMNGVISLCINEGEINGDLNVGGIAGTMNIEYDADPEYDIDLTNTANITIRTTVNDVILHCRNNEKVTSKKNEVGGIVGHQEIGLIYDCESYGNVQAEAGDNLGGIAGYSAAAVQSCYSFCKLSGNDYIGGIVGEGYTVTDCVAICNSSMAGESLGAIAGKIHEEGTARNNNFVSENLEGIDGISYSGVAERKSYEDIMKMADIPFGFQLVTVEFQTEDGIIGESRVRYGSQLEISDYPIVEATDEYYVRWPKEEVEKGVYSNTLLVAEYVPWKSSVAAKDTIKLGVGDLKTELLELTDTQLAMLNLDEEQLEKLKVDELRNKLINLESSEFELLNLSEAQLDLLKLKKSQEPKDMTVFLVAGKFYEGTRVVLQEETCDWGNDKLKPSYCYSWEMVLPEDAPTDATVMDSYVEGHFYGMGDVEHAKLLMKTDDGWMDVQTTVDGSYLVADVPVGATFALTIVKPTYYWLIPVGIVVVILVVVLILVIRGVRKTKKKIKKEITKVKEKRASKKEDE